MLKSPPIITLSYLLRYLSKRFDRSPKKVSMLELHGGLYALKIAHLLFLMVISDNIISVFKLIVSSKDLQIRRSLTYSINPAPFWFVSRRVRISYWSLTNCECGNPSPQQNNVVKIELTVFLDGPLCNEDYSCLGNRSRHCLVFFLLSIRFCMSSDKSISFFNTDPFEVTSA